MAEVLAEPLLGVTMGESWDERTIRAQAAAVARRTHQGLTFNEIRFVAYSCPKLALQYLQDGKEVLMLEWKSWLKVPPLTAAPNFSAGRTRPVADPFSPSTGHRTGSSGPFR